MTARPLFNVTLSKVIDALQGLCCHQQVVQPTQLSHQYHRNHKHTIAVITFRKYSSGNYWLFDIGWGGSQKDVWIAYNTSADAKVNGLPLKHVTVCNIFVLKVHTHNPHTVYSSRRVCRFYQQRANTWLLGLWWDSVSGVLTSFQARALLSKQHQHAHTCTALTKEKKKKKKIKGETGGADKHDDKVHPGCNRKKKLNI